jgi:hypothetical protein
MSSENGPSYHRVESIMEISPMKLLQMGFVVLVCGSTATAQPTTTPAGPATAPAQAVDPRRADREQKKLVADALRTAVNDLRREADALNRGQDQPRTSSDYFAGKTVPFEAAALMDFLNSPVRSASPEVEAYIKWQMLSAVKQFETDLVKDGLEAFSRAPAYYMPASTADELKRSLDRDMARVRSEAELNAIQLRLDAESKDTATRNQVIFLYRSELMSKLKVTAEHRPLAIAVRLHDFWDRAAAGIDMKKEWKTFQGELELWLALAELKDIQAVDRQVDELLKRKPVEFYASTKWNSKDKKGEWKKQSAGLPASDLKEVSKSLKDTIKGLAPQR